MNILITGANGQLGSELKFLNDKSNISENNFFYTDIDDLDITNIAEVDSFLKENSIDIIINSAAYTAVDKAEHEEDIAFKINAEAVKNLALVSKKNNAFLIHISTDYVFDGKHYRPYDEEFKTKPNSSYGRSKLKGEEYIFEICQKAIILRTSWLYSVFGKNFVKTIKKYAQERDQLNVVNDQIGSPTNARDLAYFIILLTENISKIRKVEIFHFSNEGVCSWYDFAKEIIAMSNINCKVKAVSSEEFKQDANRPPYSVLNKKKISEFCNADIPYWKDSLKSVIKDI
jgi:dTDP-4-dehydrorhamnose reductase